MGQRDEQKRQTRQALLNAARQKLAEGRSFSSLGLREIARDANLAAPAFYRHFRDIEALGLTLVDEVGVSLRHLLREGRERVQSRGKVISSSITALLEFLDSHGAEFRLLMNGGYGASEAFRLALHQQRQHFADELAEDIARLAHFRGRAFADVPELADAIVAVVFSAGQQMLDVSKKQRVELAKRLERQVQFLMRGAELAALDAAAKAD